MTETNIHQRLAAILAADAVGYTRLMQADERATVAALDHSRQVFREHIEAEDGRVVDTAGDSVLAVFETATGAVRAAMAVQESLGARNADQPDDRRMDFRVGVTLGEIIEKPDGTIYGDGVNIAARLEAEADPGATMISGTAFDSVRGKVDAGFTDLGEHTVKNVDAPVRMYRVVPGEAKTAPARRRPKPALIWATVPVVIAIIGLAVWQTGLLDRGGFADIAVYAPNLPSGPSIAVMPFDNLSADPDQDYLAGGLTVDVTAALGRFSNLAVLSANATAQFKDTDLPPTEIGDMLGVQFLLNGGVRRAGDQVRVDIELTDAASGQHLWSERYDRSAADLFAVQDDITRDVAGQTATKLIEHEIASAGPPTDAYDYFLRGLHLSRRLTRAEMFEAREMYKRAIELDPNYAQAYAELSRNFYRTALMGYTEFVDKSFDRARSAAEHALSLDPDNVKARYTLAAIHLQRGEFNLAAAELNHALDVNPSDAETYMVFGEVALFAGYAEQAIGWHEAAQRLDPNIYGWALGELAMAYYMVGRYEDAIPTANEARRRDPSAITTYVTLSAAFAQLGRRSDAQQAIQELLRIRPHFTIEQWGSQFVEPTDIAHWMDGLEKAGLSRVARDPPD